LCPDKRKLQAVSVSRTRFPGQIANLENVPSVTAGLVRPGKLVWHGDITVLANDGSIQFDGQEFHALEPLFLHLTGEHYANLNWL